MKIKCPDCRTSRPLSNEERININNDDFETHCHECGVIGGWDYFIIIKENI